MCVDAELEAITAINAAIRLGDMEETVEQLMNPEAQLPIVYQSAAKLYQDELFSLQIQGSRVAPHIIIYTASRKVFRPLHFFPNNEFKCI